MLRLYETIFDLFYIDNGHTHVPYSNNVNHIVIILFWIRSPYVFSTMHTTAVVTFWLKILSFPLFKMEKSNLMIRRSPGKKKKNFKNPAPRDVPTRIGNEQRVNVLATAPPEIRTDDDDAVPGRDDWHRIVFSRSIRSTKPVRERVLRGEKPKTLNNNKHAFALKDVCPVYICPPVGQNASDGARHLFSRITKCDNRLWLVTTTYT